MKVSYTDKVLFGVVRVCITLYIYIVIFIHRAVCCFKITLYLLSHFSYSSAAFRKIAQAGGGVQGQGGLLLLLCGVVVDSMLMSDCFNIDYSFV